MQSKILILIFILFFCCTGLDAGTTGKIAGLVKDAATGQSLPGVNIIVKNNNLGAASDLDGYFVILNLQPGVYTLEALMVGYTPSKVLDVKVFIDQTTVVDFKLQEETIEIEEIEVIAERPVVERDVAASRANINYREIESLPVSTVSSVISLQAGVEGMSFRGSGSDETAWIVNGMTLRDERNNAPVTNMSFTSIEEIQVQTGGFSSEFGNLRAGIINVITREGSKDRYSINFLSQYSPASPKHFGPAPNDPESYWLRPYVDEAVCWTGTKNGAWPEYLRRQFPEFEGWKSISEKTLQNSDPGDDLTPEGARQLFLWQHRRDLNVQDPDYIFDMSFGGPVPYLNSKFGNVRFHSSFRNSETMYMVPLSNRSYRDYYYQIKLTADISASMKLMVDGFISRMNGTAYSRAGGPGLFNETWRIASELSNGPKYIDGRMFSTDYWCPSRIDYRSIGVKFTHALNQTTFYESSIHFLSSWYNTNPGRDRDLTKRYEVVPGYFVDEAPFGFTVTSDAAINGMNMGAGFSNARDSSKVAYIQTKFDLVSQLNRYNHIKTGLELIVTHTQVNYANYDKLLPSGNSWSKWDRWPLRAGLYFEDKLEFEGMIAQVGLRLDYSHAGGEWYTDYNPYNMAFSGKYSGGIDTLVNKEPTKHIFTASPRIAVSFPITSNNKLYFNYGHFRQLPEPENLYLLRYSGFNNRIQRVASPNNPLPKTVAYELGYEQNLFDQFLFRAAGYYKDLSMQPRSVSYINLDGSVNYSISEPLSYEDIRGFEMTITKNRGNWVRGFINYTYMVSTAGYFGYSQFNENPAAQREFERETKEHYQEKPVPTPFARANIDFFTSMRYGPLFMGLYPLEDIRLSVLARWRAGSFFTYLGGGPAPGIQNNMQWKDVYSFDMRFTKGFQFGAARLELFIDIRNLLNLKNFTEYGFVDAADRNDYFRSLHLPDDIEGIEQFPWTNISGDDEPGEYRRPGVQYIPVWAEANRENINNWNADYLYYDASTRQYLVYKNGTWQPEDQKRIDKIMKDKAYIDMPNLQFFTFLDPRDIFWGVKLNFDF